MNQNSRIGLHYALSLEDACRKMERGHRRLTLLALVMVNILVAICVVEVYFLLQQPVRVKLEVNDLTCSNHSPDAIINISYASVQGKVRNMDIQAVDNVTLIIEIWCPVQNTNNMDLPLADRMILIQKETFNVGSIEGSSFKEFQFNIPYSASPNYDTINLSARAYPSS